MQPELRGRTDMLAAVAATHLTDFPRQCPWSMAQTLDPALWPE